MIAGCGGDQRRPAPPASEPAAQPAAPEATPAPSGPSLAVGITEPNPAFLWPAGSDPGAAVPEAFARWRDELSELRPVYYRLVLDWPGLQPEPDGPLAADAVRDGCGRAGPPCAAWAGLREQLRALAARQVAEPGAWSTLAVIEGTPAWAGRARAGCTDKAGGERARPLAPGAEDALSDFVAAVLELAAEEGAELTFWSARNEPNHPAFLYPQRRTCEEDAPSLSPRPYVAMVRGLVAGLERAPGDQAHVLGELAGYDTRSPRTTTVREFVSALPREVVCGTPIWSQHAYVGGAGVVRQARRALDAFECERPHEIWITETGVGGASVGRGRATGSGEARRECRRIHRQLSAWHADPRVTVAFQYLLREDDVFPVGLVQSSLEAAYPVLGAWQAWGSTRRPKPSAPPPPDPCT